MAERKKRDPGPSLVTTALKAGRCRSCKATVFFGMDGGIPVCIDDGAITPEDEIHCIVSGRPTYTLRVWSTGSFAFERCGTDYSRRNHPVVAGHWCKGKRVMPNVEEL